MKSHEIRQKFLDFFKDKEHLIVPSAPIVLKNDPTLMFNNSGMAQFKEYFLGNSTPKSNRIADTQKCLRVSGKHNDLEDVGFDTYHHTMFEMLGNWSFGDYFKKEAIHWAWELLTEVYKIPKNNLYVSVFEGNEAENVPFDKESWDIWKSLISEDRIILGNKKDNFWEMGDQGPCGPCSEIHVDLRTAEEKEKISGKSLVNNDHPLVVEIWNNVFMEYNRKANGSLEKLPAQHVDTGMGFERLCMALQGKTSNYDTDVFTPLIKKVEEITGFSYTTNEIKKIDEKQNQTNIAIRVIVDHVRAVAFSIADGQLPSNNGAGYVIRRILRRAIRYGFTFLNTKEPFIYKLVEILAEQMGGFFNEISLQKHLVKNVIQEEETSFLRTLDQGLQLLDKVILETKSKEVSGQKVFELKDTFGFPEDLTELILREKGFTYHVEDFKKELDKQRQRGKVIVKIDDWNILINNNIEIFLGYDHTEVEAKISRIRKITNDKGTFYQLVLNQTPFYPEGGGQVGDKGILQSANETIEIVDTKKENNLIIHFTKQLPENLNAIFIAKVNTLLRNSSAKNHSATHLMHLALRSILGTHVEQKGSLVNSDYLRFDFSHFSKVSDIEIKQVEAFVNAQITEQLHLVEHRNIPIKQAIEQGAMALFGEKYGDSVRMIEFGNSKELCGGIHVKNSVEIGLFKIISESAVASGIRRIEAITGESVKQFYVNQENILTEIKEVLKNPQDSIKAVVLLQDENAKLKKQLEQLQKEKIEGLKNTLILEFKEINEINYLVKQVNLPMGLTKYLAQLIGNSKPNSFVFLASIEDNTPNIHCYISKELVTQKGLNAGNIIKELGKYIDGNGGGQSFFASGKGKDINGINKALKAAEAFILK